jgi:hypothetical protein
MLKARVLICPDCDKDINSPEIETRKEFIFLNPSVKIRCPFCKEPLRIAHENPKASSYLFMRLSALYICLANIFISFGGLPPPLNKYGNLGGIIALLPAFFLLLAAVMRKEFRPPKKYYVSARRG